MGVKFHILHKSTLSDIDMGDSSKLHMEITFKQHFSSDISLTQQSLPNI